ncbi:unnamed protein product, partial [Iphiclides podalirius]
MNLCGRILLTISFVLAEIIVAEITKWIENGRPTAHKCLTRDDAKESVAPPSTAFVFIREASATTSSLIEHDGYVRTSRH